MKAPAANPRKNLPIGIVIGLSIRVIAEAIIMITLSIITAVHLPFLARVPAKMAPNADPACPTEVHREE